MILGKTEMKPAVIGFFNEVDAVKSGGKGKNLVELARALFPVPPGFILTFEAFLEYREQGHMPAEMKEHISACYHQLSKETGNPAVAVRSSASAEDLPNASFAGQYDTYLYVCSEAELMQRIVDCWHSLDSPGAMVYRKRMKISGENLKMAVIVQTMIDPRVAGILFTSQSYHGKEDVMIVESNWGCGETVVSGKVTPDHFVISRVEPFTVLARLPGKKEIMLRAGVETDTTEEQRGAESLNPDELAQLCRIGRDIEHHFGCPQDIEWALTGDGLFVILQSRPITRVNYQKYQKL